MLYRFSIFPITPKPPNKFSTVLVAISQGFIVERGLGCIEKINIEFFWKNIYLY
jgi:hypothetical protein